MKYLGVDATNSVVRTRTLPIAAEYITATAHGTAGAVEKRDKKRRSSKPAIQDMRGKDQFALDKLLVLKGGRTNDGRNGGS